MTHKRRAIVYLAWGREYISEVLRSINDSLLPDYPKILVTDTTSEVPCNEGTLLVIRADFRLQRHLRKAEMINYLPRGYDSFLFLDSDTEVVSDIDLGFLKAEEYGIAVAPAPHYSLDHFWGFDRIMTKEGVNRSGQLLYNTGVIFFSLGDSVIDVFTLWQTLAEKYKHEWTNDQPLFTLAMEQLRFNPYTLSISYNYRGLGDSICGIVRIWHSHTAMPEKINEYESAWPPRRVIGGAIVPPIRQNIALPIKVIHALRKIKGLTKYWG